MKLCKINLKIITGSINLDAFKITLRKVDFLSMQEIANALHLKYCDVFDKIATQIETDFFAILH